MFATRLFTVSALALAFAASAAPPASADTDIDLSIGSSVRHLHSSSVDTLSGDDTSGLFSAQVGIELNQVELPFVDLMVDAVFETGGLSGESFQSMESDTSFLTAMVGARARWHVSGMSNFFARAALGFTHVSLELQDSGYTSRALGDDRFSASTYAGGGLEILPFRATRTDGSERFGFGVRLEGGYFASSPVSMRAIPMGENIEDGAIRIPTEHTNLGTLNPSGWTARFGLVGRF